MTKKNAILICLFKYEISYYNPVYLPDFDIL